MVAITQPLQPNSHTSNYLEPYLKAIFGFVGIADIQFITVQPMDRASELREAAVANAITEVCRLAANIEYTTNFYFGGS